MAAYVSVVIPVFNLWNMTKDCLLSLAQNSPLNLIEVIVVDNASSDETQAELEKLKTLFKHFKYIRNEENLGFAKASNQGAKLASGKFLFFLNNDTILTKNWLPPLLDALASDEKLAGVGPLLLYENNHVQHLGVTFSQDGVKHLYQFFPASHKLVAKRRYFRTITAAAFLISKELFFSVNGFFEEYKNGFEDIDLCLQLNQKGYYFSCIAESIVYHLESRTPGRKSNEIHNSNILKLRQQSNIYYDLYEFVMADDLRCELTHDLNVCVQVGLREEFLLNKSYAKCNSISELYTAIIENPLWLSGYEKLASLFDEQKMYGELAVIRNMQSGFFYHTEFLEKLSYALEKINELESLQAVQKVIAQRNSEQSVASSIVKAHLANAIHKKNSCAQEVFSNWLKKYS